MSFRTVWRETLFQTNKQTSSLIMQGNRLAAVGVWTYVLVPLRALAQRKSMKPCSLFFIDNISILRLLFTTQTPREHWHYYRHQAGVGCLFSFFAIEWNCICWLKGGLPVSYGLFQRQQQWPVWVSMVSIYVQSRQDCWQARGAVTWCRRSAFWMQNYWWESTCFCLVVSISSCAFSIENLPIWVSQVSSGRT